MCQILTNLVELQNIFDTNGEVQLAVSTAGAGKGFLEARVETPDGKEHNVVLSPNEEGVYDIT